MTNICGNYALVEHDHFLGRILINTIIRVWIKPTEQNRKVLMFIFTNALCATEIKQKIVSIAFLSLIVHDFFY